MTTQILKATMKEIVTVKQKTSIGGGCMHCNGDRSHGNK